MVSRPINNAKQLPAPASLKNEFGNAYDQVVKVLLTENEDDLNELFYVDKDIRKCPDIKALQCLCRDETLEHCIIDSYVKVIHEKLSLTMDHTLNIVNLCESEKIRKSSSDNEFDPKNVTPTYMIMWIPPVGKEDNIGNFGGVLFLPKARVFINFDPQNLGNKYKDDDEFLTIIRKSQYYHPSFENIQINLTEKAWPTQSTKDTDNCGVFTLYYIHHIWNIIHKLQT